MPKIITARRLESETEQAQEYVKTYVLLPSGLLGLIFLVAGTGSLVYQFLFETYDWRTFVESTGLLFMGGSFGWMQTRYHRYLLREHPGYFAGRLKAFSRATRKRSRKEAPAPPLEHPGSKLIPLYYVLGIGTLVGASALSAILGQVSYMAAFLMPWAGFFWAKMHFWRGALTRGKGER
jgi:hypothetical protein